MATDAMRTDTGSHVPGEFRTRRNVVVLVGGVSAALAGLLIMGQEIWDIVDTRPPTEGFGESALHCTWLLLTLFGVIGMYVRQQQAIGRFGDVATLVAVLGIVTLFGAALPEVTLLPSLSADSSLLDTPPPAQLVIGIASFVLYLFGLVLFAAATWRAGVLPWRAAALLIAGVVVGIIAKAVVPGALIVLGAALVWLGFATLGIRRPATAH
jgi:hypothetical protein